MLFFKDFTYYSPLLCVIMKGVARSGATDMKFKQILYTLFVLAAGCANVFSQDGTAYNYLNTTTSSHAYALGGANISVIDDDVNLYEQNPALLGPEVGMQAGVSYMRYLGGSNFMSARFAKEAGDHAAWGAGISYFGYGEMKAADVDGTITGTFGASDIAFSGMYSHDFNDRIRGGIALKFLYSNYEQYSALAIAADLGINYYDPERDLSLSAVVANLGGQVKRFDEHYDPERPCAVFHTFANGTLRREIRRELDRRGIPSIDLLGPAVTVISTLTGEEPTHEIGAVYGESAPSA